VPAETKAAREEVVRYWTARAAALDEAEKERFKAARPEVQACWSGQPSHSKALEGQWEGKRTLLFEEMAAAADVPNPALLGSYLRDGAPVFGRVPPSGLYEQAEHAPTKSLREVLQASKWSRHVLGATVKAGKPEVDQEVWDRTLEEVAEGKAEGPFTEEQLNDRLGKVWAPARRIGLEQSGGVRPIDDFSEFGRNGSSDTAERVDRGGVDQVVGIAKALAEAVNDEGLVDVRLSSGERLQGRVHRDFENPEARKPVGCALDLKKAFKQVAPSPALEPLLVIGLWSTEAKRVVFFILRAMPFGARNCVFVFGSLARALDYILTATLDLTLSQYVDDFPQIEPAASSESADNSTVELLKLLGWGIKLPGGKVPEFGEVVCLP